MIHNVNKVWEVTKMFTIQFIMQGSIDSHSPQPRGPKFCITILEGQVWPHAAGGLRNHPLNSNCWLDPFSKFM